MKTVIIAEIGNNHNGSMQRAVRLIDEVKSAGVQIAKFQLRNLDDLYRERDVEDLGVEYAKDLLSKYNLSFEQHKILADYCQSVGVEYMCTPWDTKSVDQLEELGVQRYKIASADFDNIPLLEKIASTLKPMFLSTGMNTTKEICEVVEFLTGLNSDFTLLHCNSTYPAPFIDIELNYINTLKDIHSKVGYSGHERGISVSLAAVAIGAQVIERHVTLDKELEGPDHHASLLPNELNSLVSMIGEVECALGEAEIFERKLSQGALLNKENLGKSIVAAKPLAAGTKLTRDDIEVLAPGQGLPPNKIPSIIGKTINMALDKHEFIHESHFGNAEQAVCVETLGQNWGVPVRPHDVMQFQEKFDAPIYEFHISYKDLERREFPDNLRDLSERRLLVHAPELFAESMLLDLCADDQETRERSVENLQAVCDYCTELSEIVQANYKIKVIANLGGFSTHSFRDASEKPGLYAAVAESLGQLNQPHSEIIPQNMAPYPWHFGGQRYQNVFMIPEEIAQFCKTHSAKICLDTAHLSMYCHFSKRPFAQCLNILLPVTAHLHMSDAQGINGEGVLMGTGDVDFQLVLNNVKPEQTFIVETWQGHKNRGAGFVRELAYLNGLKN